MDREIEFSRRFVAQLQKILTFYDERNGSSAYSRRLVQMLMSDLRRVAMMPTASCPSTRPDTRFFYLMGFTIVFRYTENKVTALSIRSSARSPLSIYQKA
ncbi:MAG: type II toxin-antitoxin system RelE/ParE family toxin [Bacteroidaceae bacterium]|nr:type II toxin-antitoxin system RelE/ParE family toxin [Bacteroidaceae bacterium]